MCGIAGIFFYGGGPSVEREELLRIREAMINCGPDGAGLWLSGDNRVGLTHWHRRVAIIDLSHTGAHPDRGNAAMSQPLTSAFCVAIFRAVKGA